MNGPNIRYVVPFLNTFKTLIGEMCMCYLQLKERDAHGNTPFMTAVQCHNFKAAIYILDFVERNKGIVHMPGCIFYTNVRFHFKNIAIGRNSDSLFVCRQHLSKLAVFDEGHDLS